jgi:hypothetical protein
VAVTGSPVCTYDGAGYLQWRGAPPIPVTGGGPPPPPVDPLAVYHPLTATWGGGLTNAQQIAALNAQGLDIPTDATLVLWPYADPSGAKLDVWMESLGANEIGVLPEKLHADLTVWQYQWQTAPGFRRDNVGHYWCMFNMKRGLLGLGPNCEIGPDASSFTMAPQPRPTASGGAGWFDTDGTEKTGCQLAVIKTSTASAYVGNLVMQGRGYGGVAYSAIAFGGGIYTVERVKFKGAWRGDQNAPNREAGAITARVGTVRKIRNCEMDARDSTGARVGASCIMLNSLAGAIITDVYVHHTAAGMGITAWSCDSTVSLPMIYTRIRSEFNGNGSGLLSGACFNFELQTGTVEIVGDGTDASSIICNYLGSTDPTQGTTNNELHISGGSNEARCTVNVRNVKIDKGSRPRNKPGTSLTAADGTFTLDVQLFGYGVDGSHPHGQYGINAHIFDAAGVEQPVYIHGAWTP